jgi:phage tail-like protein
MLKQNRTLTLGTTLLLVLTGLPAFAPAAESGPPLTMAVRLEADDGQVSYFKSVSGLKQEMEVVEVREGDIVPAAKLPGRVKYGDITLKRGYITGNTEFYDWFNAIAEGKVIKKSLKITLLGPRGEALGRFAATEAWPSAWEARTEPVLGARGTEVAIEEITLVHEGILRVP